MGRRKSSGLFETLVKSAFGVGTTVHYKTNWLGQKQKVVKHHDSGKTKTYTHGCGILGNTTKTKTTQHGQTLEKGKLKQNFFIGATEHATKADGSSIERKYSPGFLRDHVTTTVRGQCWTCNGTGIFQKTRKTCRKCGGTGVYQKTQRT